MLRVKDGINSNATTATTLQTARTINGTSFNGSADITTANWGTARTLTIGNTGKSVNGSANVSWSLSEIGAAASSHTHSYVPTSTGGNILIHADSDSSTTTEYIAIKAGHNVLQVTSSGGGTTTTQGQNKVTFNGNVMYHAGYKPSKADVGLGSVNNWGASSSISANSTSEYATTNMVAQVRAEKANTSHTHNTIVSRGNVTAESGVAGRPAVAGLSMTQAYNNGYPTAYGNVISLRGSGDGQILVGWSGTDGAHAPVYVRSKRDNTTSANWSGWAQFYTSANPQTSVSGNAGTATKLQTARTINGVSFDGSANITITAAANGGTSSACSGNAATATKLQTARTINGVAFDGTGNITITAAANGGTSAACSGNSVTATTATNTNYLISNTRMDYGWNGVNYFNINGTAGTTAKANNTPTTAWWHVMRFNHANSSGYYTDLAIPFNDVSLYYKRITGGAVQNGGWIKVLDSLNYNTYAPTKTGGGASGTWGISVSGNSATATTLQTARTINGTSFNGSANITTANWGTARTITIGNTGKSVNGSGNVSWSLSEIGAAAASHTHSYLSTSGGTISGALKVTSSGSFGDTVTVGSYDSDWKCVMASRATNGVNYAGKYGVSYLSSVKLSSSDTAAMAYGAGIECYNATSGSAVRRVLIAQHSFIPMADNNMYCGTSSHRWQAIYASSGTVYSSSKDEKENIQSLNISTMNTESKSIKDIIRDGIKNTNMYSYSYKTINNNDTFVGFLGQELEKQNPEFFNLIGSSYITEEGNQQYDIRESSVIGVLWSALQDTITENEEQKEKINKLEEQEEKIKKLEEQVSDLIVLLESRQ